MSAAPASPTDVGQGSVQLLHASRSLDSSVQTLIELTVAMNWTYVSVLYSPDDSNEPLAEVLVQQLIKRHACVATLVELTASSTDQELDRIISHIDESVSDANVVFALINNDTAKRLLTFVSGKENHKRVLRSLTFVGTGEWVGVAKESRFADNIILGALFVVHDQAEDKFFTEYLRHISPQTFKSPESWLSDFWQQHFQCSQRYGGPYDKPCSGSETLLNATMRQSDIVAATINAVYAYVYGLAAFLRDRCGEARLPPCEAVQQVGLRGGAGRTSGVVYHFMKSAKFLGFAEREFSFTDDGFAVEWPRVLNAQKHPLDGTPVLVQVSVLYYTEITLALFHDIDNECR